MVQMKIAFLVLCGGKGTRIKKELAGKPKILASIAGKSALDYILEWINMYQGEKEIYLCTGYLGDQIENYIKDNNIDGVKIIKEDEQRGTLTTVDNAMNKINNEYFVVINGDTLVEINPVDVIENAIQLKSGIMLVIMKSLVKQYTLEGNKLKAFEENVCTFLFFSCSFLGQKLLVKQFCSNCLSF